MIDCHCHLDTFAKSGELPAVLARAEASGVTRFVASGTNAEDWAICAGLAAAFPRKIFCTLGLHPTEVGADFEAQLAALEAFLKDSPPGLVAVGEIGLDGHWLPKDEAEAARARARQAEAFSRQLRLAKDFGLPVVVHARDAFAEAVSLIDASGADWRRVDFHCFAEDEAEILALNARGGRASFTGTLTYKNADNVRRAALAQGLERLMLETDCPYLAPQGFRGRRNEPAFLRATADFAAALFGVPAEEIEARTDANAAEFFGF